MQFSPYLEMSDDDIPVAIEGPTLVAIDQDLLPAKPWAPQLPLSVVASNKLEHGCRMLNAGFCSFFGLRMGTVRLQLSGFYSILPFLRFPPN